MGPPSTYGFLTAGVVLLVVFALWQGRAAHPLLPPRVVVDRNRGGAYLDAHHWSRVVRHLLVPDLLPAADTRLLAFVTGIAFLPISAGSAVTSNLSTIVLMPRLAPKPLVGFGMLAAPSAMVWLAQQFPHH